MIKHLQPGDIIVLSTFKDFVLLIEEDQSNLGVIEWKCLLANGDIEMWPEFWLMNHGLYKLPD